VSRVDDVSRLISGLAAGTLPPEYAGRRVVELQRERGRLREHSPSQRGRPCQGRPRRGGAAGRADAQGELARGRAHAGADPHACARCSPRRGRPAHVRRGSDLHARLLRAAAAVDLARRARAPTPPAGRGAQGQPGAQARGPAAVRTARAAAPAAAAAAGAAAAAPAAGRPGPRRDDRRRRLRAVGPVVPQRRGGRSVCRPDAQQPGV
jgi:hypothetical protein